MTKFEKIIIFEEEEKEVMALAFKMLTAMSNLLEEDNSCIVSTTTGEMIAKKDIPKIKGIIHRLAYQDSWFVTKVSSKNY